MRLRMQNFNIMGVHQKIRFLGKLPKTNVWGGDCLKRRGLGKFADLRGMAGGGGGLAKKRGRVFEMRLYPNAYYECFKNFPTACFH